MGKTAVVGAKSRATRRVPARAADRTDKSTLQSFLTAPAAPAGAAVCVDDAGAGGELPFEHDTVAAQGTSSRQARKRRRVVRNGAPTNQLVFSAHVGGNEGIFPQILSLYVPLGSLIADVTHGEGVFWRNVPDDWYDVLGTDIQTGTDCRALPYDDGEIDCVVLDPPYMHSPGGTAHTVHSAFEKHYRNNGTGNKTTRKYHEAVLALYEDAGREAHRVLRDRGVLIVKCQDEVCSNRQRFTHVEIMQTYSGLGFIAEDLFVVVRNNRPGVSRAVRQVHARKNHSYFMVFWKKGQGASRPVWERPE